MPLSRPISVSQAKGLTSPRGKYRVPDLYLNHGGGRSTGEGSREPLLRRSCACSTCAGASFCPQNGQVSKSAAAPPTSRVVPCRCTVTSVRIVRLVPLSGGSERKNLAHPTIRWYSLCVWPPYLLAADVATVAEKRPVIPSQRLSKVVNVLDVNESSGDIPIRGVPD